MREATVREDINVGTFEQKHSYGRGELLASAHRQWGDLPPLPAPPMLFFDRVEVRKTGGAFGKGELIAELDVRPDLPFFGYHFVNDPVMPGCFQVDALLQLTGFFIGWHMIKGKGRATGVGSTKFSGEILPSAKIVEYRVDITRLILRPPKICVAFGEGKVFCDGKLVTEAHELNACVVPS